LPIREFQTLNHAFGAVDAIRDTESSESVPREIKPGILTHLFFDPGHTPKMPRIILRKRLRVMLDAYESGNGSDTKELSEGSQDLSFDRFIIIFEKPGLHGLGNKSAQEKIFSVRGLA
jgi:hypothetical protein